jgi:hypothetical protein
MFGILHYWGGPFFGVVTAVFVALTSTLAWRLYRTRAQRRYYRLRERQRREWWGWE